MRLTTLLGGTAAVSAFALAGYLLWPSPVPSESTEQPTRDRWEEKHEPFDQFWLSRSYPDDTPDLVAYQKALKEVAWHRDQSQHQRSNPGADNPWRLEGPTNIGGRINVVAVSPIDDDFILVGNSTGGVFATTDGGTTWNPITDSLDYLPISEIEFDPVDPNTIYIGTGDHNIGGAPHIGNGVYRSTDAGATWTHLGLDDARIVSRIVIDPNNTDILYAATMGLPFERNNDRGLYKSTDGGQNWTQSLLLSNQAGVIDLVMDPTNSSTLYASGWDRIRNNTESTTYGPDSRVYKTVDGGQTWDTLTNGLPSGDMSRVGLAISALNPQTVFAIFVDTSHDLEGLYKTTDGGASWTSINLNGVDPNLLGGFGWYFGQVRVSPYDDDEITLMGVDMYCTTDGGQTWFQSVPDWWTYEVHADKHDMIYLDNNSVLLATDGGLYRSDDAFQTWTDIEEIPNNQFYRCNFNVHNPGVYTAGAQDNGTTSGNYLGLNLWSRDFGGDGFQPLFDYNDPNVRYVQTQRGNLYYSDNAGAFFNNFNQGIDGSDRRNWDMPWIMSHHNPQVLYTGTYRVYKNDFAPLATWVPISNDITDGQILEDRFHTITCLTESAQDAGVLYAGTVDGNISRTTDGGTSWTDVTGTLPDRYVTSVEASPSSAQTVFVTHSGYKDNDNNPHIHRSDDQGQTWTAIDGDLPDIAINHVAIYPDSSDSVIFIGTDGGVFFTEDAGSSWDRLGNNMPIIPVADIIIDTITNRLVAATYARSLQTFPLDSLGLSMPPPMPPDTTDTNDTNISVFEFNLDYGVEVFPNPAREQITISANKAPESIYILDLLGNRVMNVPPANAIRQSIDLSGLPRGTYLLELRIDGRVGHRKFLRL